MKFKNWHALALISCAVLLVYYPALFAPLNLVDDVRMVNDLLNRPEFTLHDFIFPDSKSFYRPLVVSSFLIDRLLWNLETPFLHLENVLLHWCNALLVFGLAQRVGRLNGLKGPGVPFCAALFFGLHPINTEAVIWVAGRADLLAGFFILLTLLCTLNFFKSKNNLWVLATMSVLFLGCLAKETTLFVWPGLIVAGWLVSRGASAKTEIKTMNLRTALFPAFGCILSIAGYFALRSHALYEKDLGIRHLGAVLSNTPEAIDKVSSVASPGLLTLFDKLEKALTVFGFYARKIIQPFPLNFGILEAPGYYFWVGVILVIFCLYLLIRASWPGVFILTAASLASVAVLVAFGGLSWTPVAERYMYSPSAMVAIGGTLAGARFLNNESGVRWPTMSTWLVSLLLLVFAVGTFQRTLVWQDNVRLFSDTVEKSPDFAMAHNALAVSLMKRGDHDEAIEILRDLEVPDFQVASLNKLAVFVADGEYEKAREFLIGRLENPGAYHRVILERLVKVLGLLGDNSESPLEKKAYQIEQLTYLNDLWQRTREPFYLYRIGRLQMLMGDRHSAQHSFEKAYQDFPEGSIYKKPAGKLAKSLKKP